MWKLEHFPKLFYFFFFFFQELALYGEFTICETLYYFGRVHGMDKKTIETQIDFLMDFLELSSCADEFVRKLR